MKQFENTTLNFPAFKEWIIQAGIYMHTKKPHDYSEFPPIYSLEKMMTRMRETQKKKGANTILFEDPEATAIADSDLVIALNKKIKEDPNYPIPEGFKKRKEKTLVYTYGAPSYLNLSESQTMALDIMDELLTKLFDMHFLEPVCTFEEQYSIRPIVYKGKDKDKGVGSASYFAAIDKKIKAREMSHQAKMDPLERRKMYNERPPRLPTNLKLEVAKFPLEKRAHGQETAEVLEEILRAVERNQTELPPRKMYGPGGAKINHGE